MVVSYTDSLIKAEAKRLGLRGYSRLRKAELINLIARASPNLDEPVPEINDSEILKPRRYVKPVRNDEERRSEAQASTRREIRKLEEMLGLRTTRRSVPEIKVWNPEELERDRKISEIKEINRTSIALRISQTASALRGFARQFRIEGVSRHGPREFMQIARTEVLKLMRANRQTRVRMILNCEMSREELFSENVQILNSHFHSDTVENLEATNESEVYDSFIQTIEERIQNFNQSLIFIWLISSHFVDPLLFLFPKKSQPRKRLST